MAGITKRYRRRAINLPTFADPVLNSILVHNYKQDLQPKELCYVVNLKSGELIERTFLYYTRTGFKVLHWHSYMPIKQWLVFRCLKEAKSRKQAILLDLYIKAKIESDRLYAMLQQSLGE